MRRAVARAPVHGPRHAPGPTVCAGPLTHGGPPLTACGPCPPGRTAGCRPKPAPARAPLGHGSGPAPHVLAVQAPRADVRPVPGAGGRPGGPRPLPAVGGAPRALAPGRAPRLRACPVPAPSLSPPRDGWRDTADERPARVRPGSGPLPGPWKDRGRRRVPGPGSGTRAGPRTGRPRPPPIHPPMPRPLGAPAFFGQIQGSGRRRPMAREPGPRGGGCPAGDGGALPGGPLFSAKCRP